MIISHWHAALYMFLLSYKQTVKRTDANTGPNLGTETVSWANHPQCSTPSLGPPPFLLFLLPFLSRFLFIWSICVSFSQCESVDSGSFWAGVWSCVLSSIANKPSVTSIPRCVCVCVTWFWFAFVYTHQHILLSLSHGVASSFQPLP